MENFDLRKFLVENKITTNSKTINEDISTEEVEYEGYLIRPNDDNYYSDPRFAYEFYNLNDDEESIGHGRSIQDCKEQIDGLL